MSRGVFRVGAITNQNEAIVRWTSSKVTLLLAALSGALGSACQSGGVGDPCIPEDEYTQAFPGYNEQEVNAETRSFQCETRVCLAANFRGRVTCPYGQADPKNPSGDTRQCFLPGATKEDKNRISVAVDAQLQSRQAKDAVYCSCRCAGDDKNATYCECPSGYGCQKLVANWGLGKAQLTGSYCIKDGTYVANPGQIVNQPCTPSPGNPETGNCGAAHPDNL
jgi:hypothetical protein